MTRTKRRHAPKKDELDKIGTSCSAHTSDTVVEQQSLRFDFETKHGSLDRTLVENELFDDGSEEWLTCLSCPYAEICPKCGRKAAHTDQLVIACDGACRGNGHHMARAAIGVFVCDGSALNDSRVLDLPRGTSQVAELIAGLTALRVGQDIKSKGIQVGQLIIKSDSEYLVKGMTEWIVKWKANGWRTAKGFPVKNENWFRMLNLELQTTDIPVSFWLVPRAENVDADALANDALDA